MSFEPLVSGIRKVLEANGVKLTRIQLPMTKQGGFRHPLYRMVGVTWDQDTGFADTFVVLHTTARDGKEKALGLDQGTHEGPPWTARIGISMTRGSRAYG